MALDSSMPRPEFRPPLQTQRRGYSMLCVESDPDMQARLARMLTLRGHRVVGTASGDGALALMGEWPVDLVLIAEHLRDGSGLDEVRRVVAAHPTTPIAVLAVDPTPTMEEAARRSGACAVVRRPLDNEGLDQLMQHLGLVSELTG